MKLVLFTPIVRTSAIGRVSRLVVGALIAQGHDVKVVRTELDQDPDTHRFDCPIVSWADDAAVVSACLSADICVYQVANHYPFHAGSLRWMPALPGVVCLHDHFVGHLFEAWASTHAYDPDPIVRAWYGDDVVRSLASAGAADLETRAELAPMTEWIGGQSNGVLTHSRWALDRVLRSCPGPVRWAPLPYELPRGPIEPSSAHPGRFRLITVGHMNSNKRVASVIEAIASDASLRERVVYTLIGKITSVEAGIVESLAAERGVDLAVVGEVDDDELAGALAGAHAVAALRWPCLEAASASAIEAMLAGKPTLVTRAAFYDEIPDECVLKIGIDHEVEQVGAALRSLVNDPALRAEIGARAHAYAAEQHRAEPYAQTLVDLARDALVVASPLELVRHIAQTLESWAPGDDVSVGEQFVFEPLDAIWSPVAER